MDLYARQRRYFAGAYETGEHGWPTTEPSDFVVKVFKKIKPRLSRTRLLDIGCGEGRHTLLAARYGFHTVGLDYQPPAIHRALRFAKEQGVTTGFSFLIGDVFHLPFQEKSFDILIDFGCLHHVRKKDFSKYLDSILTLLGPGGYYVLSCFSTQFKHHAGERRTRDWLVHRGHYDRFFRKQDLNALFGRDFDQLDYNRERDGSYVFHQVLMRRKN
ncbi:MAG TPA: class I SAM-dependent methyltransferase [Nitrospiria bacterium]|jgi:SAM-dependent methyltransferase|nr:class I SAM-dependent methyltransferase [Nitrospiria bacterium]